MKLVSLITVGCCAALVIVDIQFRSSDADVVTPTEIQVPCSSGDSTAAWNTAIRQAVNGVDKIVHLLGCTYHFSSAPAPITGGIEVVGQGLYTTLLERDYSPGSSCSPQPACEFIRVEGVGETIKDLAIFAKSGTTGGWALHIVSSDARQTDFVSVDNVYVSGYGTYAVTVFLDGVSRLTAPKGIRAVHFTNVSVFNGTVYGFECWNCVDFNWTGGGVWQGFGTTQYVVVGGPLSAVNGIAGFVNGAQLYWAGNQLA